MELLGKDSNSEANFIPYGLAYIASYAKTNGHAIDVIDLRKLKGWKEFTKEIRRRSPEFWNFVNECRFRECIGGNKENQGN